MPTALDPATNRPPASWVVTRTQDGAVILETFSATVADAVNRNAYTVEPVGAYLQRINRSAEVTT